MRIIAGTARGRSLKMPDSITRPTSDRVREALFSSLGSFIEGARVLDLFAGSGGLGLESLSRGASSVLSVEHDAKACRVIEENAHTLSLQPLRVQRGDVIRFLDRAAASTAEPFQIIFADPPYARDEEREELITTLMEHPGLPSLLADEGAFILENFAKRDLVIPPHWHCYKEKSYGDTRLTYLTKASDPEN